MANQRPLRTLLLRAASPPRLQGGRQHLGGPLAGRHGLHTGEQPRGAPFHVPCLVPGGALAEEGTRGSPTPPRVLCPVHVWSPVCRGTCLDALPASLRTAPWGGAAETAPLAPPQGLRRFTAQLDAKAWSVYATRSLAGPEPVLDYLSRYTHRVAIAHQRRVEGQDGQVHCPYRNRRHGHRVQIMPLAAHELIRRFLLPVVPQGLQRMRHIGSLANRGKARALRQGRQLLDPPPAPPSRPAKSVAEWLWQWTGTAITRCPECGQGPLRRLPLPPLPHSPPSWPPLWDSS